MRNQERTVSLLTIVFVAALLATAGCSADNPVGPIGGGGSTIQVDASGAGDFESVAAAVQAATPGTVIRIGPGNFDGRIVVSQGIELVGSGPATVLTAPGTVQSYPDDSGDDDQAVIEIRGTGNIVIRDLAVRGPVDGIVVRDSFSVALMNVTSSGNGDEGVDIRNSRDVTVTGTFSDNGDIGVQARDGSAGVTVSGSTISGNAHRGVRFRDSVGCSLSTSTIDNHIDDGVLVRDSTGAAINDNTIAGNTGYGVRIDNAPDTVVQGNSFEMNGEGDVRED